MLLRNFLVRLEDLKLIILQSIIKNDWQSHIKKVFYRAKTDRIILVTINIHNFNKFAALNLVILCFGIKTSWCFRIYE